MPDPISGTNGSWNWTRTPGAPQTAPPGKACDSITIDYEPSEDVECRDIKLILVTEWTGYDANNRPVARTPDDVYPGDHPFRHRRDCQAKYGLKYYCVDYRSCEADPFVDGDDPQDGKNHPLKMPKTTPMVTWGAGVVAGIVKIVKSFELCAVCLDNGAILDCIRWTSTATANPLDDGTIAPPQAAPEPQTGTPKAIRAFVQAHVHTEEEDGETKRYWFCPETDDVRGEVPDGFWDAWKPDEEEETGFNWLDLNDAHAGEGRLASVPGEVLTAALENVSDAAVKLTWSGDQDRTVASLIVSPHVELEAGDITPFVRRGDRRLNNDFVALAHRQLTPRFCSGLLRQLSNRAALLTQPPAAVTVTIVANVGRADAVAFIGSLQPAQLATMLEPLRSVATRGDERALAYLWLNLALQPEYRSGKSARGCLHPANFFPVLSILWQGLR